MKPIDTALVGKAVAAYCADHKMQFAEGSLGGHARWLIFPEGCKPDDGIVVRLVEGKLACEEPAVKTDLSELIMDMRSEAEPAESPRAPVPRPSRPAPRPAARNSGVDSVAGSSGALTLEKVRQYFCSEATDEECQFALEVCAIRGLNPFKKDCYFVKYEGKNPRLEIIVSKDFLMKRAMANPDFQYFRAGIVVQRGDEIQNVERYFAYPSEKLIGGWAEVKRRSIEVPFRSDIPMQGFAKGGKFWESMPGLMIRKVAAAIALREAFPDDLGGLYDQAEIGASIEAEFEVEA